MSKQKTMKHLNLFLSFLLICDISFSQDTLFCGFDELYRNVVEDEPYNREDTVEWNNYTIPVIVHICHSGEEYGTYPNLSDEDVYESIEHLNSYFAGENSPTMNDSKIKFCLANMDNPSAYNYGIQRHNVFEYDWFVEEYNTWESPTFSPYGFRLHCYDYDYMCIDYENTINIWVAPWIHSPQGYGGVSITMNNLGGVVIQTWQFRPNYENGFPNTVGRVILAHEFGHCFGLRHTFAYTDTCEDANNEVDCETDGDQVCDTPPTIPLTCYMDVCSDNSDEENDIIVRNIMNYTGHCANEFTDGQIDRMQWKIQNTTRISLTHSECVCNHEEDCVYDLNNNGVVDMRDLLDFLVYFNNGEDCNQGDFNNDNEINTNDLLSLLGYMGFNCY